MIEIIHSDFSVFCGIEFLELKIFTNMLNHSLKTEISHLF